MPPKNIKRKAKLKPKPRHDETKSSNDNEHSLTPRVTGQTDEKRICRRNFSRERQSSANLQVRDTSSSGSPSDYNGPLHPDVGTADTRRRVQGSRYDENDDRYYSNDSTHGEQVSYDAGVSGNSGRTDRNRSRIERWNEEYNAPIVIYMPTNRCRHNPTYDVSRDVKNRGPAYRLDDSSASDGYDVRTPVYAGRRESRATHVPYSTHATDGIYRDFSQNRNSSNDNHSYANSRLLIQEPWECHANAHSSVNNNNNSASYVNTNNRSNAKYNDANRCHDGNRHFKNGRCTNCTGSLHTPNHNRNNNAHDTSREIRKQVKHHFDSLLNDRQDIAEKLNFRDKGPGRWLSQDVSGEGHDKCDDYDADSTDYGSPDNFYGCAYDSGGRRGYCASGEGVGDELGGTSRQYCTNGQYNCWPETNLRHQRFGGDGDVCPGRHCGYQDGNCCNRTATKDHYFRH